MKRWYVALTRAQAAPRCGAKTRSKAPCQAPAMANGRCRMHGGKSTGAPCGSRHGMYKHGRCTEEHLATQAHLNSLLKETARIINSLEE